MSEEQQTVTIEADSCYLRCGRLEITSPDATINSTGIFIDGNLVDNCERIVFVADASSKKIYAIMRLSLFGSYKQ